MTPMKMRFRFAVGLGTILAAGIGVVACGGDDTTVGEPTDAGTDGTVIGDGGGKLDGSSDATVDGSSDAGDASSDGGLTGGDAGDGSAPNETVQLTNFQTQLATAYCNRFATACQEYSADAGIDGGVVNVANCISTISKGTAPVFQGSTVGFDDTNATSRGDTVLNATTAKICINEITAIDYANISADPYKQATLDCFSVATGSLAAGAGCYESIECAPSLYCKKGIYTGPEPDAGADAGDGGSAAAYTGACAPLEAVNTDCTDYPAGDSCSYLGVPGSAFCDYSNDPAIVTPVCQNVLFPTDGVTPCYHDVDCVSGLCDPRSGFCTTATTHYTSPNFCGSYP